MSKSKTVAVIAATSIALTIGETRDEPEGQDLHQGWREVDAPR